MNAVTGRSLQYIFFALVSDTTWTNLTITVYFFNILALRPSGSSWFSLKHNDRTQALKDGVIFASLLVQKTMKTHFCHWIKTENSTCDSFLTILRKSLNSEFIAHNSDFPPQNFNLMSHNSEFISQNYFSLSQNSKLTSHNSEFVSIPFFSQNSNLTSHNSEFISHNYFSLSQNSKLTSHNSGFISHNSFLFSQNSKLTSHNSGFISHN